MKLSDYIIDFLVEEGVTHIFEVCGGALGHIIDSLYDRTDISSVPMHHEMAAAIAAEGYSRVSGNVGVAMATSGPGATNLITGIGSCFFDSIPSLFITGQVNTYEFKFDKDVRQIGFQETDIVSIVKPIVKDAEIITDEKCIKYTLEKYIHTARDGRPGPVLLDIPLNIQRADIDPSKISSYENINIFNESIDSEIIKDILKFISESSRPVILAGGGIRLSHAEEEILKFVDKTGIPVVTSLMGLDAFPHDHESFVGMIGTYGNRHANLTLANADLLIVLGSRLDTRQTGTIAESFARGAKIIHVDIDPSELNNKIKSDISINSDVKMFLMELNENIGKQTREKLEPWQNTIKTFKKKYPHFKEPINEDIHPNHLMHKLSEFLPEDAIICVDVGQNQMWASQSIEIKKSQRFLTQGGMASIGSALPMAIGASFAQPNKTIVVITGDGGFQLNTQELQTVFHHNLPIKIVLLNNHSYGMIRQFQEQYFDCRFQSTGRGYSCPDFQKVVTAYGIDSMQINSNNEINGVFKRLFNDKSPMFLEVLINPDHKALPKLSVNMPLEDQEPLLPFDELRSNMFIDVLRRNEENED
ncbi:MAG: thiamine pyrophosphate-binding protein [Methanobacterium sp.]|uniref:thiamine pyrophosphate-binding protein n=1 Tax=Methanobacterium sp. TaxID=2164 RepID=UPI003D652287|nr:thiamine pyrophosphate-binding protein [Methanobacterium sp.]